MVSIGEMVKQAVVNYAMEKVGEKFQPGLDSINHWVSNTTGQNLDLNVQSVATGLQDGTLMQQVEDIAVGGVGSQISKKLDPKALKNVSDLAKKYNLGGEILEKFGAESIEELAEKGSRELAEKAAKHVTGALGEKAGKMVAEKGAAFLLKKAARCIPGVGALTGGAIEAYQYNEKWGDMREQYGEATSAWLKENKGIDVAPEKITDDQLKMYAESNRIIKDEIQAMRAEAAARTTAGAFGIFGMIAEAGYDVVDWAVGSRSAAQVMDDMRDKLKEGQSVTKQDVLDMVNHAYSGEKGKTTKNLSAQEKRDFDAVAERYAQQLNSGELKPYDMLSEVGDGKFHTAVQAQSKSTDHTLEQGAGQYTSTSTLSGDELRSAIAGFKTVDFTVDSTSVGDVQYSVAAAKPKARATGAQLS